MHFLQVVPCIMIKRMHKTTGFLRVFCKVALASLLVIFASNHDARAMEVSIAWDSPSVNLDGSPLQDLGGFRVLYGTRSGGYFASKDVGLANSYTVTGLNPNTTYYFTVVAYDQNGNQGPGGNEAVYEFSTYVNPNDIDGDGIANWDDPDDDGDGLLDYQESNYGTGVQVWDTDSDGVSDGQEIADGTNPLDAADVQVQLYSTVCSEWNGFLGGMWNFFEHSNLSNQTLSVETTLYNSIGQPVGFFNFSLAPGAQYDVPVHAMAGWGLNQFGRVCSSHSGGTGDLDGRMVYYKPAPTDSPREFQFAFAMPMSNGYIGKQFVPFNTIHPGNGSHLAANWIQVTNMGSFGGGGSLKYYNQNGQLIGQDYISVLAGGRADYSAHRFGNSIVGLVEWVPDANSTLLPFIVRNVRYLYDNQGVVNSFDTAFQLEALRGASEPISVPLNSINRTSVLEVANVGDTPANIQVSFFGGKATGQTIPLYLRAKSSIHLIADEQIGSDQVGFAKIVSDVPGSVISVAMQYGRDSFGNINFMYGLSAKSEVGSVMRGSFNTFVGNDSWLTLVNPSEQTVGVSVSLGGSNLDIVLAPKSMHSELLDLYVPQNSNGIVTIQPSIPNSISANVTRVKDGSYVIPTQVR